MSNNYKSRSARVRLFCAFVSACYIVRPTTAAPTSLKTIRVYFPKDGDSAPSNPFNLQPVSRRVSTITPGRGSLLALLSGPTATEQGMGFHKLDSEPLGIGHLIIERSGLARVNFVSPAPKRWAGDLSPATFKQAVIKTLRQFPTVRRVRVAVNGRTDFDSLQ